VCENLGRSRYKNTRSRQSARYIRRAYFRHNDSNIPEHYIDNFKRPAKSEGFCLLSDALAKLAHQINSMDKQVKSFSLQEHEASRWNSALKSFSNDIGEPMLDILRTIQLKALSIKDKKPLPKNVEYNWNLLLEGLEIYNKEIEHRKELTANLNEAELAGEVKKIMMDIPLLNEQAYIYKKYDVPKRLEMLRKRNELLSEAHFGSENNRYNDYRGSE
jgi:hypothetical protein